MHRESPTPNVVYTPQPQESSGGQVYLTTACDNGIAPLPKRQPDRRETSTTPVEFHLSTQTPPKLSDGEKDAAITEGKIKSNFTAFRPYIISCVKVTDLIVYYDHFTDEQKKRLGQQNKSDPTAATETAFETIEELHRPDKFSRLLCALDYAGYPKVVRILKGNLIPVNDKHRKIIKNSFRYIYERLSTTDIVPFLLSAGVINYFDTDEIHAVERTQGRGKAVIDLLLMLPNRRRDWFPAFIKALIESGQTELADIIDMDVSKSVSVQLESRNLQACTLCDKEKLYREASHFCKSCNEFLCSACEIAHRKFQPTRQHSVVTGDKMQQIQQEAEAKPKESIFSKCTLL